MKYRFRMFQNMVLQKIQNVPQLFIQKEISIAEKALHIQTWGKKKTNKQNKTRYSKAGNVLLVLNMAEAVVIRKLLP